MEQADGQVPECGHDLRAFACVSGARVLGVGGVADPADRLDAPLSPGDPRESGCAGLARVEAGDGVDDFLAGQLAVCVVAVATDPGDPADVREVDPGGVGDPQGAADGPAVGEVQLRPVRLAGPVRLDGVEGRPLQGRLVSLDIQEVVRVALLRWPIVDGGRLIR